VMNLGANRVLPEVRRARRSDLVSPR
jgi:hypothetical protein